MKVSPLFLFLLGAVSGSFAATTSVVTWTGAAAKGGSSTNTTFASFGTASINASGAIAFSGSVQEVFPFPFFMAMQVNAPLGSSGGNGKVPSPTPAPVTPTITNAWNGLWITDSRGSNRLVARVGAPFGIVDAGGFGSLGEPLLNNSNLCAFSGNYYPGFIMPPPIKIGAPVTTFYSGAGIWTSSNSYSPVAFAGETAPGYPNPLTTSVGTLSDLANQQSTNGYLLSNSPVTFTNWVNFSSIDRIVLPDTGEAIFFATVGTSNYYYPPVPTNPLQPMPMFVAIEPLIEHGIWTQSGTGSLSLIAREGEVLNIDGSNRTVETISFLASTNEAGGQSRSFNQRTGDLVYSATFTDGNQALILESSTSRTNPPLLLCASGDPAPGFSPNTLFTSFGNPVLNASNHVAFQAIARNVTSIGYGPGPVIPPGSSNIPFPGVFQYTNSWSGIWASDAQGKLQLVVKSLPTSSGIPLLGGNGFRVISDPVYNKSNNIAFTGTWYSDGPPVGNGFNGGKGVWTSSNLTNPVAWIGQTAPGYPNPLTATIPSPYSWSTNIISYSSVPPVFSSFDKIALPDTGRLILWGTVSATNSIPLPPIPKGLTVSKTLKQRILTQHAIWTQNAQGGLSLIVREGGSLVVNGKSRVIASLSSAGSEGPTGGQDRAFNQTSGALVYLATFTDGTQAIVKVTP